MARDLARAYLAGGATVLQLRAKALASGALLELAAAMAEDARAAGGTVIVNDRADIAALAGAGLHLGQDDLVPADARRVVGADAIVGFSTHTADQIDDALRQPLSYLAIGPVFATTTKDTGFAPVGLDMVARAAMLAAPQGIPVVAIGGITLDRAASVRGAGAASVAVITDLLVGNPEARVRQYLSALS
jgi:thiamine-phosphate pyrophosphorylase